MIGGEDRLPEPPPRAVRRRLERVYRSLPVVPCKGLCSNTCGPVICSEAELGVLAQNHADRLSNPPTMTTDCPLLDGERCSAYEDRPFICRVWGSLSVWKCPHGCKPSRQLSLEEFGRILDEIRAISPTHRSLVPSIDVIMIATGATGITIRDGVLRLSGVGKHLQEEVGLGGLVTALEHFEKKGEPDGS